MRIDSHHARQSKHRIKTQRPGTSDLEKSHQFELECRCLQRKTKLLLEFPGLGRPGRVPGTRELVVHDNYVVPYRVKGDMVQIIRVQHVARLWPKNFQS